MPHGDVLRGVRTWLQALVLAGAVFTGIDLALMQHSEDVPQFTPFVALAAAVAAPGRTYH